PIQVLPWFAKRNNSANLSTLRSLDDPTTQKKAHYCVDQAPFKGFRL
ncbi:MAG: hypothetical protein ACI9KN_002629, partial [Gammaproteobacteria bacterium]